VLFKAYYEELVKDCIQNLFQKLWRREGLRAVQVVKAYLTDKVAGNYFSLFMVMMMSGRFVGTFLMRYIAPNKLLATFALANVLMCLVVAQRCTS
jgi:hypothetical protein